jgi:sodium/proline symporter
MSDQAITATIFAFTLAATFFAAYLGRKHSAKSGEGLAGEKLNKWLIGLSAGATANSGFVVTGAVGLGYMYGMQWVMLPLAWLLGDIIFWRFFPAKINEFGRVSGATTISEILTHGQTGPWAKALSVLTALVIVVCLGGYTTAQWIAGEKFLSGAFGVDKTVALGLFALVITAYTSIGGFRGSVYADSFQAVLRIIGTTLALVLVIHVSHSTPDFSANIAAAGPSFLQAFPSGWLAGIGFVLGFAAAALGFGLGQPQIVSRYLAGSSPKETQAAWPIYICFVQGTWIAMTVFGMYLRGVMPSLSDPEAGLAVFFKSNFGPVITGVIAADIFATIAATSNSLLVAISQAVQRDIFQRGFSLGPVTLAIGAATMGASFVLDTGVVALALSSTALMSASIAPAIAARVLGIKANATELLAWAVIGVSCALIWKGYGLNTYVNEAVVGALVFTIIALIRRGNND